MISNKNKRDKKTLHPKWDEFVLWNVNVINETHILITLLHKFTSNVIAAANAAATVDDDDDDVASFCRT